ncbi:MAG: PTS transporter subunit EIIA [Litoreibacter sp.]|nr:PTS transporter subunit EIIA [Litoreibacter sp.]
MQISKIIEPEAIRSVSSISSKKRLFQEIGDLAASAYGLCPVESFNALQEREALGPTGVGRGVALPHARLDGLDDVRAVFLRVEKPMDFESADRQPVDLFFALFAPADSGVEHLRALASASRTMRNKDICAKLRANADMSALYAILADSQAPKAA